MNQNISIIEILPNELFQHIFQYISASDLFNIFACLNVRFSSLVKSQQNLHLTLDENWDDRRVITPAFAPYITALIVRHDEFIHLSYFANLRSLKLCMPTAQQCNAILPHILPNHQHLHVLNFYASNHTEQLCRMIFSSSFPHLRMCQIDRITLNHLPFNSSLSLNQLTVAPRTWKINFFPHIFNAYPNLRFLRIIHLEKFHFQLIPDSVPTHLSIEHLFIRYSLIEEECLNQLDWLLSTTPRLKTLMLYIDENETDTGLLLERLSRTMLQRVPYLIRFRTKIFFHELPSLDLNSIKHLHPLFFNVKLQCDVCPKNNHLLTLSDA
jgi:hypothetical protein